MIRKDPKKAIINFNSPPVFPVKLEKTYTVREYPRDINPKMIKVVPKLLFLLKGFFLIYLTPMYIPIAQKKRIRIVKATNGRSTNILRLDPNAKISKITKENIVKISNNIERVRKYIPKLLCFILILRILIIKE